MRKRTEGSNGRDEASDVAVAPPTRKSKAGSWSDDPARGAKDAEHLAGMETGATAGKVVRIEIPEMVIPRMQFRVVGDSSLIVHHFSAKSIRQMLDKQMGNATEGRAPKNPEQDFKDSLYVLPDGRYGFPAIAFKSAAVEACTSLKRQITKKLACQSFHITGDLLPIVGDPKPREDMVRINGGQTADIRYRAEFFPWSIDVEVRFNPNALTVAQIVNLFNLAGFAVGVGDWRVEKGGNHGMFHVELIS